MGSESFSQSITLKPHKLGVNDKIKNLSCPICQKGFFYKRYLLQHVKSVHEKMRPFNVKYAPRAFHKVSILKLTN